MHTLYKSRTSDVVVTGREYYGTWHSCIRFAYAVVVRSLVRRSIEGSIRAIVVK